MGELDLVKGTLRGLGYDILFHGVAVQPGKPLLAAVQPAAGSGARDSGDRAPGGAWCSDCRATRPR